MMRGIDTYILMFELHKRIADYLFDPEPVHDTMLSDLFTKQENVLVAKRMEREMRTLMARYKNILQERLLDEDV